MNQPLAQRCSMCCLHRRSGLLQSLALSVCPRRCVVSPIGTYLYCELGVPERGPRSCASPRWGLIQPPGATARPKPNEWPRRSAHKTSIKTSRCSQPDVRRLLTRHEWDGVLLPAADLEANLHDLAQVSPLVLRTNAVLTCIRGMIALRFRLSTSMTPSCPQ